MICYRVLWQFSFIGRPENRTCVRIPDPGSSRGGPPRAWLGPARLKPLPTTVGRRLLRTWSPKLNRLSPDSLSQKRAYDALCEGNVFNFCRNHLMYWKWYFMYILFDTIPFYNYKIDTSSIEFNTSSVIFDTSQARWFGALASLGDVFQSWWYNCDVIFDWQADVVGHGCQ